MTRTMAGGHAEHFIAYLGTVGQCTLLIMYAAFLEARQVYSLDRHPSFEDLAFSSAGVVFGGLFLLVARDRILSWLRID
jgi:hypothetical protein